MSRVVRTIIGAAWLALAGCGTPAAPSVAAAMGGAETGGQRGNASGAGPGGATSAGAGAGAAPTSGGTGGEAGSAGSTGESAAGAAGEQAVLGTSYYVDSVNGDDSRDGLSESTAWKTMNAVSNLNAKLQPGDALNIRRGSAFMGDGLYMTASGAIGRPILVRPYGDGPRPTFTKPVERVWQNAVDLLGSWITLQGIRILGAHQAGVEIGKAASHVVVQDVEIAGTGIGVQVEGDDNLVIDSYAHDLKMIVNDPAPDNDFGAVGYWLYGSNNELAHNRCVHCRAPSADYGVDGGVVEVFGNTHGNSVHHNWGEDSAGFIEMGGGLTANLTIDYNVALRVLGGFACLHNGGSDSLDAIRIENNTAVIVPDGGPYLPKALGCMNGAETPTQVQVRNDIFVVEGGGISDTHAFAHDHNLFFLRNGGSVANFALAASDQLADPRFVDLNAGELQLQATSPAIGSGTPLGYTRDYAGQPVSTPPDLGAFSFVH